jgi:uncharacterized protein YegP (UPF0339 family)
MKRTAKIEMYVDKKGEWRWRFVARNGRIIADSGEGYKRYSGARKNFLSLVGHILDCDAEFKFNERAT